MIRLFIRRFSPVVQQQLWWSLFCVSQMIYGIGGWLAILTTVLIVLFKVSLWVAESFKSLGEIAFKPILYT